jgi:excisionase family DNA binding protein
MSRRKSEEKLLTIHEVAKRLKLSYITIWRWTKEGRIKTIKFGQGRKAPVRIPESELKKFLEEHRKE